MQYFGGKQKIAKHIADFINSNTHTHYVEPFCGSCNVASKVNIKNKTLNDKNNYLIAMFQALKDGWIPPEIVSENDYQSAKKNQDKELHIAGFVGFACSFAGKFWGGYQYAFFFLFFCVYVFMFLFSGSWLAVGWQLVGSWLVIWLVIRLILTPVSY